MSNVEGLVGGDESPAGKPMNCNSWGTYEAPGTSETAALCSGGIVTGDDGEGRLWAPCPSKEECRKAKNERVLSDARQRATQTTHLPMMPRSSVNFVGGPRPMTSLGAPTSLPQKPLGGPATIITPESTNPHLNTPRVLTPTRPGMHSPTFLPKKNENWLLRLGKNVLQGALNAFGWHTHDFTQHVDIFPHKDDED
jgi:hypothetical protein